MKRLIVGIDASRNRSGGAIAHLRGILEEFLPERHGIHEIHIWSYEKLLNMIPDKPWLVKHSPTALSKTLGGQLLWQAFSLSKECKKIKCDILFTTDASTLSRFKPMVVLSQDMLSYEPGVMSNFGFISKARLRLWIILYLQNMAFRRSSGVIFLTNYASKVIQNSSGLLKNTTVVNHGVDDNFRTFMKNRIISFNQEKIIKCLYISNTAMYKHQWNVIRAIAILRQQGVSITLTLIGGGYGRAQELLQKEIRKSDPRSEFVRQLPFVPQHELPVYLAESDIFVFASSCENMPVTLIEAMVSGLPIACSDRGPMPEILRDGGLYFDPENPDSIALAIKNIVDDESLAKELACKANKYGSEYFWKRCSTETFSFITDTFERFDFD
jgi:glycosyltransferase involved in cell wall biosynthesis